ncbi:MAG: hypothetical protein ABSF99_01940 [Anaerolineales bacterium]|jgi:hypothetical protein
MKLNAPKTITFWIAVAIAVVSFIVYTVHVFEGYIPKLGGAGYLLLLAAFVLLSLGLTTKKL